MCDVHVKAMLKIDEVQTATKDGSPQEVVDDKLNELRRLVTQLWNQSAMASFSRPQRTRTEANVPVHP